MSPGGKLGDCSFFHIRADDMGIYRGFLIAIGDYILVTRLAFCEESHREDGLSEWVNRYLLPIKISFLNPFSVRSRCPYNS